MSKYIEKRFCYTPLTELNLYYCGKRINTVNHSYGPQMREHFLLVYVKKGDATVTIGSRHYSLKSGQLFCMFPHEKIYYKAKDGDSWSNLWLGIYGTAAKAYMKSLGISKEYPIYNCPNPQKTEKAIDSIIKSVSNTSQCGKLITISELYRFLSTLYSDSDFGNQNSMRKYNIHDYDTHEIEYLSDNIYIRDAENYIRFHYDKNISVSSIAKMCSLSPEYFSRLFKRETGKSPQQMIIEYRISTASKLLRGTSLSISEISGCVGIKNEHYFSKLFKEHTGFSPSKYRQSN